MREALGPYRASLTQGRRRSVIFLFFIAVGIIGAIAWSSFRPLENQRRFLARLEKGNVTPQNFFEFSPGVSCFGGDLGPGGGGVEPQGTGTETAPATQSPSGTETSPGGKSFAPAPSVEPGGPRRIPGPGADLTCQFIAPDGTPIGQPFKGDPFEKFSRGEVSQQFIDDLKPQLVASLREQVANMEKDLSLSALFQTRVRALGTFVGILFAVLFAATFFGAEIRWGVWRTLLTHEPRRSKMIASKFSAMLTYLLIGFIAALVVTTAVDVVMRNLLDVNASAGPRVARLAKETGWAALSLGVYATMAGALTLSVRTSLAGVTSLLMLLGDHLLVTKFTWLRAYLPVQQIASLLPTPATVTSGYVWPQPILIKFECVRRTADSVAVCKDVVLKPIPHWRASLVLGAWLIGLVLVAWAVFRSRDVPQ